jgi:hypothetical protein
MAILPKGAGYSIVGRMTRENFIPFAKRDLVAHLAQKIPESRARADFLAFCSLVEAIYHFSFLEDLDELKTSYASLDPDRITGQIAGISPAGGEHAGAVLVEKMKGILVSANYREISRERILEAFEGVSPRGLQLKVDVEGYALLALYYREEYPESLVTRSFLRKRKFDYSVFRHVVLLFQVKDTERAGRRGAAKGRYRSDKVYLKLFKNVPTVDLEMLFPDTEVQMRLIDKLKVIVPLAIGAASSLYKIIGYILGHGSAQQLWTQVGFWALVGGLFGVALKGFSSYRNAIERYLKSLTESLYFQNLDNNSGVMKYLLDDAEEEECKELILGYFFLNFETGKAYGLEELDERIEAYFRDELKAELDFEVDDSIRKLKELRLLGSGDGKLSVLPPAEAIEELKRQLLSRVTG